MDADLVEDAADLTAGLAEEPDLVAGLAEDMDLVVAEEAWDPALVAVLLRAPVAVLA